MTQITMLDLFAGIGGFSLAGHWAGFETAAFCEIDPFCQKVLAKNFPGVPIHADIHELPTERYRGVNLITGGFPCQPWSYAGKQRGTEDDRHLWPEMARVIAEVRPRWVVGENVAGFTDVGLDICLADLESLGYEAWPIVLSACAVGAWHQRKRAFIVANSDSTGLERWDKRLRSSSELPAGTSGQPDARGWPIECPVRRVAHGIPDRVDRIRAIGNAVVPQVAFQILNLIAEHERKAL